MKARKQDDRTNYNPDITFNVKVVAGLVALVAGTATLVVLALGIY